MSQSLPLFPYYNTNHTVTHSMLYTCYKDWKMGYDIIILLTNKLVFTISQCANKQISAHSSLESLSQCTQPRFLAREV